MICLDEDMLLLQSTLAYIQKHYGCFATDLCDFPEAEKVIEGIIEDILSGHNKQEYTCIAHKLCIILFSKAAAVEFKENWLCPKLESLIIKIPPIRFNFFFKLVINYKWHDFLLKILDSLPTNVSCSIINSYIMPFCLNEGQHPLLSDLISFTLSHAHLIISVDKHEEFFINEYNCKENLKSEYIIWQDFIEIVDKQCNMMNYIDQIILFKSLLSNFNKLFVNNNPILVQHILNEKLCTVVKNFDDVDSIYAKCYSEVNVADKTLLLSCYLQLFHCLISKLVLNDYDIIFSETLNILTSQDSKLIETLDTNCHSYLLEFKNFLHKIVSNYNASALINDKPNLSLLTIVDQKLPGFLEALNKLVCRKSILSDGSVFECVQRNSHLLFYSHLFHLVDQVAAISENTPQKYLLTDLILSAYERQPLYLQQTFLVKVHKKFGCKDLLLTQKYSSQKVEFFNKIIQGKLTEDNQIFKMVFSLGIQSLLDVLQKFIDEAMTNSVQIPLLAKIVRCLGAACHLPHPISQQSLVIHIVYKVMINSEFGENSWQNLLSLLQLLCQSYKNVLDMENSFEEPAIVHSDTLMEICILPHLIPPLNFEQEFLTQRALTVLATQLMVKRNTEWLKGAESVVLIFCLSQILDYCECTPNKVILKESVIKTLKKSVSVMKKHIKDTASLAWLQFKLQTMNWTIFLRVANLFENFSLTDYLNLQFEQFSRIGWFNKVVAVLQAVAVIDNVTDTIENALNNSFDSNNHSKRYIAIILAITKQVALWSSEEFQKVMVFVLKSFKQNDYVKSLSCHEIIILCIIFENIIQCLKFVNPNFIQMNLLISNMVKIIKDSYDSLKQEKNTIPWMCQLFCHLCDLIYLVSSDEGETIFILLLELQSFLYDSIKNQPVVVDQLIKACLKIPLDEQRELILKYFSDV